MSSPAEAVANLTHAIELRPDDAHLLVRRGAALRREEAQPIRHGHLEPSLAIRQAGLHGERRLRGDVLGARRQSAHAHGGTRLAKWRAGERRRVVVGRRRADDEQRCEIEPPHVELPGRSIFNSKQLG